MKVWFTWFFVFRVNMDEFKKLRTLLLQWNEHNEEHAQTYRDWAEEVLLLDNPELIGVLRRLSVEMMLSS